MNIGKDFVVLNSWGGAACSFFLFFLIGAYTLQKLDVLLNKRDVDLITTTISNANTYEDFFDSSMGLNIAVAFTSYDNDQDPIDDPTIGEVVFNHYKWGQNPDG